MKMCTIFRLLIFAKVNQYRAKSQIKEDVGLDLFFLPRVVKRKQLPLIELQIGVSVHSRKDI